MNELKILREQYIKNANLIARMEANNCTQCIIDGLKGANAEVLRMIRAREEYEAGLEECELTIDELFDLINEMEEN